MKNQNISKSRRLAVFLSIALLGSAVVFAQPTERIIYIQAGWGSEPDLAPVTAALADGWTVKHQSAAAGGGSSLYLTRTVLLFTLTPPSPERAAENDAKRKAEFERKRAELLAKKKQAVEAK